MRVHHLDCGLLRMTGPLESSLPSARLVCHCLLIETDHNGLVLVDTGLGVADMNNPRQRLGSGWVDFADPVLDREHTATGQLARLGFDAADVRHIVLTHLHRDHTGGLPDFPHATVHVCDTEYRAVSDPTAAYHQHSLDRFMAAHRAHHPQWSVARVDQVNNWFEFDVAALDGLPEEILLIPLPGHSPGHCGVAVQQPEGWLLHAGDAYFYHGEIEADPPQTHPELQRIQDGAQIDQQQRLHSLDQLRRLFRQHRREVEIFCAHDPWEFCRASHWQD